MKTERGVWVIRRTGGGVAGCYGWIRSMHDYSWSRRISNKCFVFHFSLFLVQRDKENNILVTLLTRPILKNQLGTQSIIHIAVNLHEDGKGRHEQKTC